MRSFDRDALAELQAVLRNRPAVELDLAELRRACVLIPLVENERGWSLIFLQRATDLSIHSGQIAFPGGAAEKGETLEDAALRETEEELGIARSTVKLIGRLDDLVTISEYVVAPFIGVVSAPPSYVLQAEEVADAFEVPIEALLDERNPEIHYLEYRGNRHPVYHYLHGDRLIWGLTGRMVKAFLDLVRLTV